MFRTEKDKLRKVYESRKLEVVSKSPDPACVICKHCWYQAVCLRNVLNGHKPLTCCVYNLFYKKLVKEDNKGSSMPQRVSLKELTLEEVIKFTCVNKCVERQSWKGDPVPHTPYYCERYCPISRYILNIKASNYDDVPHNCQYPLIKL